MQCTCQRMTVRFICNNFVIVFVTLVALWNEIDTLTIIGFCHCALVDTPLDGRACCTAQQWESLSAGLCV